MFEPARGELAYESILDLAKVWRKSSFYGENLDTSWTHLGLTLDSLASCVEHGIKISPKQCNAKNYNLTTYKLKNSGSFA
jgi:hypothetical protein